jgi:hypothetical protein
MTASAVSQTVMARKFHIVRVLTKRERNRFKSGNEHGTSALKNLNANPNGLACRAKENTREFF